MSENRYVRSQKGLPRGKWETCDEDKEDFAQEKLIQEWLKREGRVDEFRYEHINRKGNARNTFVRASVRLDQQIPEDGSGTFADLIAGSDGRDLEGGGITDESLPTAEEKISGYLSALSFNKRERLWLIKTLKLSILENNWLLEKSQTDLELWKQFEPFST